MGSYRALGYSSYAEYLAGPEWAAAKARYRASGRPRVCARCGNPSYELHHLTYRRLGRERLTDLEALCRGCHQGEHSRQGEPKRGEPTRGFPWAGLAVLFFLAVIGENVDDEGWLATAFLLVAIAALCAVMFVWRNRVALVTALAVSGIFGAAATIRSVTHDVIRTPTGTVSTTPPAATPTPPVVTPATPTPSEGFVGGFATDDRRQRCVASRLAVTCATPATGQQVILDEFSVRYVGQVSDPVSEGEPLVGPVVTALA